MDGAVLGHRLRAFLLLVIVGSLSPVAGPSALASPTSDPCYSAPNVNTGDILNEDCVSWICITSVTGPADSGNCNFLVVTPPDGDLFVDVLWMPQVMMTDWALQFMAQDQATGNWSTCPEWSGSGMSLLGSLPSCNLEGAGPWLTALDFDAPPMQLADPTTYNRGLLGLQIGREIL